MYNEILTGDEKFVFLILKSFLDFSLDKEGTHGQVFPTIQTICKITGWDNKKVIRVINSLVEKCVVEKIHRGLNKPNIYILSDYAAIWAAENIKEVKEIVENDGTKPMTVEEHIAELNKLGYDVKITKVEKAVPEETEEVKEEKEEEIISEEKEIITDETMLENKETMSKEEKLTVSEDAGAKEKRLVSDSDQTTDTSTSNNYLVNNDNTTPASKSQASEKYSLEQIKLLFDYDFMISDNLIYNENVDVVMSILHDTLNTTKETIRVNGEDKPAMVVIARLMKLSCDDIMYMIHKFLKITDRIINPRSYMLTLLFNAKEQCLLDMQNEANYDMAHNFH